MKNQVSTELASGHRRYNHRVTAISEPFLESLRAIVGREHVITQATLLKHRSADFHWFSPVLKEELKGRVADVLVQPANRDQLRDVVAASVSAGIPITPRGAGTGNYGQAVPMQGGVLLSLKRLDRILSLTPEQVHVEAGVILYRIEMEARKMGAQLRFFPSTLPTATAGGFLAGGSTGIGGLTWGNLWEPGNVLQVSLMTIEPDPQIIEISDPVQLQTVIHNCGLVGIILDLTYALAPALDWRQYVVTFDSFESALRVGMDLAFDESLPRRLVTPLEWPAPSYFTHLVKAGGCPEGKSMLLLQLAVDRADIEPRLRAGGGQISWHETRSYGHKDVIQLTDFSWNHTTLWAIKADPGWTYLQEGFDKNRVFEQLELRKARYGKDIVEHIEFSKSGGDVYVSGLSLVRFHSKDELIELMAFCESIGVAIYSPHTTFLDDDTRWDGRSLFAAKRRWDPHNLLNPGHLRTDIYA